MLLVPEYKQIDHVTVYRDDALWYRFYAIPSTPRVRRDSKGEPVFLLTKYAFDKPADADGRAQGGGYMNFDVEFDLSDAERAKALAELQADVDREFAARKADPKYAGDPALAGATPPRAVLTQPTWSKGVVKLLTMQDQRIVTARVAEGPASALAANAAVFNVDLSTWGATLMQDVMVGRNRDDKIDLTVLQVVYDLAFLARLPSVHITVSADSSRVYEKVKTIGSPQSPLRFLPRRFMLTYRETLRENNVDAATLAQQGIVKVVIDQGDAKLNEEALEKLRKFAFDMFDTMIKDAFLKPAPGEDPDTEDDGSDEPGNDASRPDPAWAARLYEHANRGGRSSELRGDVADLESIGLKNAVTSLDVRPGYLVTLCTGVNFQGSSITYAAATSDVGGDWNDRFQSARVTPPRNQTYQVRKKVNTSKMKLEVSLDQSRVLEWPIAPQATLETFFTGMTPEQIALHVRQLPLDDPFFSRLQVPVKVIGDFDGQPVAWVEVEISYAGDDSRLAAEPPWSQQFTKSGEVKTFDSPLRGTSKTFRWRSRVGYKGNGGASPWGGWIERSGSGELAVSVADTGRLSIELAASGIKWDIVQSISVTASYADAAKGVAPFTETRVLDSGRPAQKIERWIYKPVTQPVRVQATYALTDGRTVEGAALDLNTDYVPIPMPPIDMLDVELVMGGDWADVSSATVALKYTSPSGRVIDRDFHFSKVEDSAHWTVPLTDPTERKFQYQTTVVYKTGGRVDVSRWITAEGDQVLPIVALSVPRLRVLVLPNLIDFQVTPTVTVTLTHAGRRGPVTKTLSFTSAQSAQWEVPLAEGEDDSYRYSITYLQRGGDPVTTPEADGPRDALPLPPLHVATSGSISVRVNGAFIDWAVTPLVELAVRYVDTEHGVDVSDVVSLSADARSQVWKFDVKDTSRRRFRFTVTYYLKDGTPVALAEQSSDLPSVVLKPYSNT
ncbi:MAG: hypothetical protein U0326_21365 [Polyangiales bacterium]